MFRKIGINCNKWKQFNREISTRKEKEYHDKRLNEDKSDSRTLTLTYLVVTFGDNAGANEARTRENETPLSVMKRK